MPLTPLPASSTKRYFMGLQNAGQQHFLQIRVSPVVTDSQAIIDLNSVAVTAQAATYVDYTWNTLLVAELGSDIRNPVAGWVPVTGTHAPAQTDEEQPLMITARGRAHSGRKVKASFFGQFFIRDADWLYTPSAPGAHASLITLIQTSANYFLANDGTKPVWRSDFTIQYNDHWIKTARP